MKPTTLEWIDKAEGDFATAQVSYRTRRLPNPDAVCFHSQQCVEKYLKARLDEAGLVIPRTHNLFALLTLILPIEEVKEGSLQALTIRDARFKRQLGLIYNKDRYQSQAARAFLALISVKQWTPRLKSQA
ncbi:MAG: HEPN domain-containing protein [Acidobacteriota bacterium]